MGYFSKTTIGKTKKIEITKEQEPVEDKDDQVEQDNEKNNDSQTIINSSSSISPTEGDDISPRVSSVSADSSTSASNSVSKTKSTRTLNFQDGDDMILSICSHESQSSFPSAHMWNVEPYPEFGEQTVLQSKLPIKEV